MKEHENSPQAWWNYPLAFTCDARLYHRCRFLLPPSLSSGRVLPWKRRIKTCKPSQRKACEMRFTMHSPTFSILASLFTRTRRATPVESARDDAPIVGGCTSRYRRTRMRDVRGAALSASLCEGPASRRATQLTPLAARSWLNAP